MGLFIGIMAVVIAFIVIAATVMAKNNAKLASEGKIVARKDVFYEKIQEYTLAVDDAELVTKALRTVPYEELRITAKGNTVEQVFTFEAATYEAGLYRKSHGDGKSVYCFNFTQWKTMRYGTPQSLTGMNMLLTAIEKAMLSVDPNTQVRTEEMKVKTKARVL